ncbi:hypothetical protein [Mangrovihabitans endophyticus]|uniref:Uncharacterized protein n=1 Tax=Mangrovihabitans endophyticus TaxID=1751298 RepID=A0A8J3C1H6_9ACTN|nr:hypothetical protein [Mangrovihabitans endophyticus]GGK96130.1 hypothetical protein GCM10012284_32920 [Mangrovihabitans endophyticus]
MNDLNAPDLLDGLMGLAVADRRQAVSSVVLRVWESPTVLLGEISPTQAITAVAVIAAGLPGAAGRPWLDDRLAAVALPGVTSELAGRALCALDVIVGRDRESVPLELHVSDGAAAQELLDDLRDVLMDGIRLGL